MRLKIFFISLSMSILIFPSVCFPQKPDPDVWEYYGKDSSGGVYYCSKVENGKSSGIISFRIYYRVTDEERKERVEKIREYDPRKSSEYQNYDHDISVVEIDCGNKLTRMEEYTEYDRRGNSLKYDINNDMTWENIPSNSVIETFYKKNCSTGKELSGKQ